MSQATRICLGYILLTIVSVTLAVSAPTGQQRGDLNSDGIINPTDVVLLIDYFFHQGPAPDPVWVVDCNCDNRDNVSDLAALIRLVYRSGPALCDARFALAFDGTNDLVEIPFQAAFNTPVFTLEAWIKIDEPQVDYLSSILDRWGFYTSGQVWAMWINQDDTYSLWSASGGVGVPGLLTAGEFAVDRWYHIAYTRDIDGMERLFIDGVKVGEVNFPGDVRAASTPLRIGHSNGGPLRAFYGCIDEVRIWNIARSAEEITATKNIKLTGNEPGLIGYWDFDEGAGDLAGDLSPSNASGRLGREVGVDDNDPVWVASAAPVH